MHLIVLAAVILAALAFPVYIAYYRSNMLGARRADIGHGITVAAENEYRGLFAPRSTKQQPLLERFDSFHAGIRYWWNGLYAWVSITLGLTFSGLWVLAKLGDDRIGVGGVPAAVVLAFLGAFTWTLWELINRGRQRELTPNVLIAITVRVLTSVPLGYAFSLLIPASEFAAFAVSAFPMRDLRLLLRQGVLQGLGGAPSGDGGRPSDLKTLVQGIGSGTLARLEELQIVTVHELAYSDPVRLMVETGGSLRHLLEWIDQSLLAMYAGDKIALLPRLGIRGAIEARHFYLWHCVAHDAEGSMIVDADDEPVIWGDLADRPVVKEVADLMEVSPEGLANMLAEIAFDPHTLLVEELWGAPSDA